MSENQPKLKFEGDKERTATRSPPKKSKVEQSVPKKEKLKQDADKAAEKSQHLRFGKAEITPDEASRMTKQQKRAMYAAVAARFAAHREVDQYEDDNVGTQALNEGLKSEEAVSDYSKNRYARKLKKKAKLQAKKNTSAAKSSAFGPDKAQNTEASSKTASSEGGSNWFSRWRQKQDIQKSYRAAARSGGTVAQTVGDQKAASSGASVAKSGMERVIDKGKSVVSTAVNGIANFAKSNAHVLWIVGVFLLLLLLVMSAFSSCSIIFSGTTQVSGQTIYTAEDRDIKGTETDYKKLEKDLDKKINRTPQDHPGYDEYQYHLDNIEHDPWQLTSFLTTLYDDYTRSEVQSKLQEIFKKQYHEFIRLGPELYIEALDVLLNAWNGEPDSMSSANLLGICRFVELYHSEYNKGRLIAKLRQVDAFTIFRLARTAGVNLPGKTKYLQQVYTIYNGGSRRAALPLKF